MPQPGPAYVLPNGVHLLLMSFLQSCQFTCAASPVGKNGREVHNTIVQYLFQGGWLVVPSRLQAHHLSAGSFDSTIPKCALAHLAPHMAKVYIRCGSALRAASANT